MIDSKLIEIWSQQKYPVIFFQKDPGRILLRLCTNVLTENHRRFLYRANCAWPEWNYQYKCWKLPKSWLPWLKENLIKHYKGTYLIQSYRPNQKCAPACWNAQGDICECSCAGVNHGLGEPEGNWQILAESFAIQYGDKEYYYKFIK